MQFIESHDNRLKEATYYEQCCSLCDEGCYENINTSIVIMQCSFTQILRDDMINNLKDISEILRNKLERDVIDIKLAVVLGT